MGASIENLQCTLFNGRSEDRAQDSLYQAAYTYWKQTWGEIFRQAGSPDSLQSENFLRQDLWFVVHSGSEVAGLISTTLFHVDSPSDLDHAYFRPFPEMLRERLRRQQNRVMSGEYLCVHPSFRKSEIGFSLADVLIGLLMQAFFQLQVDTVFGTAVKAMKVQDICARYGYKEAAHFQKYGLDCLLLFNNAQEFHDHPDPRVRQCVAQLWSQRSDLSQKTLVLPYTKPKAA